MAKKKKNRIRLAESGGAAVAIGGSSKAKTQQRAKDGTAIDVVTSAVKAASGVANEIVEQVRLSDSFRFKTSLFEIAMNSAIAIPS